MIIPRKGQRSATQINGSHSLLQVDINFELEKLRTELRHTQGMYAVAQTEVLDASRKVCLGNNDF